MNGFLFLDKYLVGSQVGDDQLLRLLLHRPHHFRRGTLRPHLLLRRLGRLRLQLHVLFQLRLGLRLRRHHPLPLIHRRDLLSELKSSKVLLVLLSNSICLW